VTAIINHTVPISERSAAEQRFEEQYIGLRQKEDRVHDDDSLYRLPVTSASHPLATEWNIRKRSSKRLINYLKKSKQLLQVLEVGCGNGWLSHQLAAIEGSSITGIDINFTELQQAARVFSRIPNLRFEYGSLENSDEIERQYDIIVFAASIQYFSSLKDIIGTAMKMLRTGGEVHILDSPFYDPAALAAAKTRTQLYYTSMGFQELSKHYYHHCTEELSAFDFTVLYQPNALQHYLLKNKNPFPWICIKNSKKKQ
jgi:2-polyprenyl-3-methyl-5-hydroxy-6-metoxy-1,4-benzoquinol methylase